MAKTAAPLDAISGLFYKGINPQSLMLKCQNTALKHAYGTKKPPKIFFFF